MTAAELIEQTRERHAGFLDDVRAQVAYRSLPPDLQEAVIEYARTLLDAHLQRFSDEVNLLIGDARPVGATTH